MCVEEEVPAGDDEPGSLVLGRGESRLERCVDKVVSYTNLNKDDSIGIICIQPVFDVRDELNRGE